MSWLNVNLNESLSNIKGQLTNLASNVLSETTEDIPELDISRVNKLQKLVTDQETEIKRLQRENSEILKRINSNCSLESWSWDALETPGNLPVSQTSSSTQVSTSVDDLKQKICELERDNLELTQSLEQLDQDCQQTTDKLVVIKDELQTENSCLKLQHQDLHKEIAHLKGSLTNLQQEKKGKDEKIELLVAQLEGAKQTSLEAEQSVSLLKRDKELEEMVSDFNEQISSYEKELAELRQLQGAALESSQARSSSGDAEAKKYYNALHDEIAKLLDGPECLLLSVHQNSGDDGFLVYQKLIHNVVDIMHAFKSQYESMKEEKEIAMREKQLLISAKEQEVEQLKMASQEASRQSNNKTLLIEDLENECNKLGHNNELLIQRLQDAERQGLQTIPEASEELEKCYKRIQQLELANDDVLSELKSQLAAKEKDLQSATATAEEYITTCHTLRMELQDQRMLKEEIREYREDRENIEEKRKQNMYLAERIQDYDQLTSQVAQLLISNRDYSLREKELERFLGEAKMETLQLKEEIDRQSEAAQEKQRQMNEMNEVVDEMERNIRKLQKQVEMLSKENEQLVTVRSTYIANYKSFREDVKKLIACYVQLRDDSTKDLDQIQLLMKEKNELFSKIGQMQSSSDEVQTLQCDIAKLRKDLASGQMANSEKVAQNEQLQRQLDKLIESRNEVIALVQSKHQESLIYHTEIQRLQQLLTIETEKCKTFETQLAELNGTTFTQDDLDVKEKEIEELQEQNAFLREKCEKLAESLLHEQRIMAAKEVALQKQLESLRQHLLEVEAMYTKEVQAAETKCSEMQAKLQVVVEQEKTSSNRFTSASIRSNQQLETLQTNLQLVTNQRDELKRKVSEQEDQMERQNAAVCNLQIVLEQFQRDKEKVIYEETQRVQRQILAERDVQSTLQQQIHELQRQLDEGKAGLKAAVRLSDQVEMSKQQVTSLRDEVTLLQRQLANSEDRHKKANNQADGRVDKLLVKNLVIGLIACNNRLNKDQNQILKIISTVLDFNQQDIEKVNLHRKDEGSWFSNLLQTHALPGQAMSSESLTQAFVKFLEAESKPRCLPNLLDTTLEEATKAQLHSLEGSANSSRKTSVRQSPILLNEVVLPTFADFSTNRNSSAILKNVLKDNSNTG